jgi:hypothetical protein
MKTGFALIVSSPLKRSLQTATLVATEFPAIRQSYSRGGSHLRPHYGSRHLEGEGPKVSRSCCSHPSGPIWLWVGVMQRCNSCSRRCAAHSSRCEGRAALPITVTASSPAHSKYDHIRPAGCLSKTLSVREYRLSMSSGIVVVRTRTGRIASISVPRFRHAASAGSHLGRAT